MTNFLTRVADMDPMTQFAVTQILRIDNVFGFDISITNVTMFMALGCLLIIAVFGYSAYQSNQNGIYSGDNEVVAPTRYQMLVESIYMFVRNTVLNVAGKDGAKFVPFVFTLFTFVLFANVIGMSPYAFTTTSQLVVTATLSVTVILTVIIYGLWKHQFRFLKLFAPPGAQPILYILLTPIEVISFFARPVSLALRLFANMLAGHVALKLFAGFAVALASFAGSIFVSQSAGSFGDFLVQAGQGGFFVVLSVLSFIVAVALNALEFLVAGLQAFVFAILTSAYLRDALHPDSH